MFFQWPNYISLLWLRCITFNKEECQGRFNHCWFLFISFLKFFRIHVIPFCLASVIHTKMFWLYSYLIHLQFKTVYQSKHKASSATDADNAAAVPCGQPEQRTVPNPWSTNQLTLWSWVRKNQAHQCVRVGRAEEWHQTSNAAEARASVRREARAPNENNKQFFSVLQWS